MKDNERKVKSFFVSGFGKVVLTILMYVLVWGVISLLSELFDDPTATIILLLVFIVFGWKALSKITPDVFLLMPIGGWITYYIIKGILSFIVGFFVAPYVIAKGISTKLSDRWEEQLFLEDTDTKKNS